MNVSACAAVLLVALASASAAAEQFSAVPQQDERQAMVIPIVHNPPATDLNHRGSGSDKSDELGVPYYNYSR